MCSKLQCFKQTQWKPELIQRYVRAEEWYSKKKSGTVKIRVKKSGNLLVYSHMLIYWLFPYLYSDNCISTNNIIPQGNKTIT